MRYLIFLSLFGLIMFEKSILSNQKNILPTESVDTTKEHPIKVRYTNYRGETAVRTIVPQRFYWGKTEYHPEEQWLVEVWDCERDAVRVYALKDIVEWFVK